MDKPSITTTIIIVMDENSDTYRTKSCLEVGEEYIKKDIEMPRDILLAMIFELELMADRITEKAGISDEEVDEYIKQRVLVSEETNDPSGIKKFKSKKKDAIDNSIDHLFDDEDNL